MFAVTFELLLLELEVFAQLEQLELAPLEEFFEMTVTFEELLVDAEGYV